MSVFSNPVLADRVASLISKLVTMKPDQSVAFPEITGRTTVRSMPTRHGPVGATIYYPARAATRPGVYVNFHGGGFVIGQPEQDDPWCRFLAAEAGVVVVNVDYALAPFARFPAAIEQCYDVVQLVSGAGHDWDGKRLCVGGLSAGGNIAAAVARMSVELAGPAIALQVLHCPGLDLVTPPRRKHTPLGRHAVLHPWMCEVFNAAYIPDPAQRRHRFASPAYGANADDLDGVPPALVVTAEFDRVRDEALRYAARLNSAGSLVAYHEVQGVDHAYNIISDAREITYRTYSFIARNVAAAVQEGADA